MKKKTIYNIITTLTIVAPTLIYIILSATLFNIEYDYILYFKDEYQEAIIDYGDYLFYYSEDGGVDYTGIISYNDEVNYYGINLYEGDIIKVDRGFVIIEMDEATNKLVINDIRAFSIQTTEKINLPVATFISLFAVLVVILIKTKKMDILKEYKRLSVFLSLTIGTAVLAGINLIVSNMLNVFIVALVSWTIYCLEYLMATTFDKDKKLIEAQKRLDKITKKKD